MNMFNWQAAQGQSVVGPRFRIYWAVTVPFTLIILLVWFSWLEIHKGSETEPIEDKIAAITGDGKNLPKAIQEAKGFPKLTTLW